MNTGLVLAIPVGLFSGSLTAEAGGSLLVAMLLSGVLETCVFVLCKAAGLP